MAKIDQKFTLGPCSVEMHVGQNPGDSGANPASLHDGGANVSPNMVFSGNAGKQLRIDTQFSRITNPA